MLIAAVTVFAAGVVNVVYARATGLARGVVVTERLHDFGEVPESELLTHQFAVWNTTGRPVELSDVASDCTCTRSGAAGTVVPPGGTALVPVTLNTAGVDDKLAGGVTLHVRRAGGGKTLALARLVVTATVRPDYHLRPRVIDFGVVTPAAGPQAQTVTLAPHALATARVTGVRSRHPAFEATAGPVDSTGATPIRITYRPTAEHATGTVEAEIVVETTSPRRPSLVVLARATSGSVFDLSASAVVVGADVTGPVVRELVVHGPGPVRLTDLTADAGLHAADVSQPGEDVARLRLTLSDRPAAFNGHVRFLAVCGEHRQEISIPVHRLAHPTEDGR